MNLYKIIKELDKKDFINTKWRIQSGQGSILFKEAIRLKMIPDDGHNIEDKSRLVFFGNEGDYPSLCMVDDDNIFSDGVGKERFFNVYFDEEKDINKIDDEIVGYDKENVLLCDLDGDALYIFKKDFTNQMEKPCIFIKLTKKELKLVKELIGTHQFGKFKVKENGSIDYGSDIDLNDEVDQKDFEKAKIKSKELRSGKN